MNLDYLLDNAAWFTYELRKFYAMDESPIKYYMCKSNVVVISTKKLYVFYFDRIIDYRFGLLNKIEFDTLNHELGTCSISLDGRLFNLEFNQVNDFLELMKYYDKYKE